VKGISRCTQLELSHAVESRCLALCPPTMLVSAQAPDKPTYIEIEFEKGDPVKLDGAALSPAAMLTALNKVAGDNGIGRVDIVESRFVGEGVGAAVAATAYMVRLLLLVWCRPGGLCWSSLCRGRC